MPLSPTATGSEIDHVVGDAGPVLAVCDRERPDAFGDGPAVVLVDELVRAAGRAGARNRPGTGARARTR